APTTSTRAAALRSPTTRVRPRTAGLAGSLELCLCPNSLLRGYPCRQEDSLSTFLPQRIMCRIAKGGTGYFTRRPHLLPLRPIADSHSGVPCCREYKAFPGRWRVRSVPRIVRRG